MENTAHKELQKAIEQFENQFNVEAQSTGYEMTEEENGGIREEEYWVNGLIESEAEGLNFKVGGWFSIDRRDNDSTIYCRLAVKMNDEDLEELKAIQSSYNQEKEEWEELRYEAM